MRRFVTTFCFLSAVALIPACGPAEHWPSYTPDPAWQPLVTQALNNYIQIGMTYKPELQEYATDGDYLNEGLLDSWSNSNRMHLDAQGIPMINYGGKFYYNPVTVSFYALSVYGKYLRRTIATTVPFFNAVHRLLLMQDERGAFTNPFPFQYYLSKAPYEPGWVSGMSQGMALSVIARAYLLTGDPQYLTAGARALEFLVTPTSAGGVMDTMEDLDPSLAGRVIFEEWLARPASYTLNGFMYTLLGVFDWSEMPGPSADLARVYFDLGIDTLRHILPYYDIGGFTAYDMSHITYHRQPHIGVEYHANHIWLLHALVSITGDEQLQKYEQRWASYVPK
jgi:heparosan-N-sulfate-glucuronate 5-epimerase